jgi:proline iminopeptidase
MKHSAARGAALFHHVVGAGAPVVVMHGGLGLDHTYLASSLGGLPLPVRWVFYDQRGNGRSPAFDGPTLPSLDDYAADAATLCDQLGLDRVVALGHSAGGLIALAFAHRCPERVRGVVLCATAFDLKHLSVTLAAAGDRVSDLIRVTSDPNPADAEFHRAFLRAIPFYLADQSEQRAERLMRDVVCRSSGYVAFRDGVLARGNYTDGLESISVPVLAIHGAEDRAFPPALLEAQVHEWLPAARIETIARAGHFPFDEQPEAFGRVLGTWLDALA